MTRYLIAAGALVLAIVSLGPVHAERVKAGVLTCDVSAGLGFIVGSQKEVSCLFSPDQPGPQEAYAGTITKIGLDIGVTGGGVVVWGVFTETDRGSGFLAGDYVGASGEASLAAGLGANVLIGGSNQTVALQPLSVSGQVGLNLAVGVADLHLRPARR
jgi:hypothetical protein